MGAASSTKYQTELKVCLIPIFFIIYLLFVPVGVSSPSPSYKVYRESMKEREKLVGSRPPGYVNKCLSCKPCIATLVNLPHQNDEEADDDTYYLLSLKCKCGNKLFQP